MTELRLFAVLYKRGPTWNPRLAFHEQPGVGDHRTFLASQYDASTLAFGGPFLDDSGGLSVFWAPSLDRLEEILGTDQAVQAGLLVYEVHPYLLGFEPRPRSRNAGA
jgi:uncharacterized protein YciI